MAESSRVQRSQTPRHQCTADECNLGEHGGFAQLRVRCVWTAPVSNLWQPPHPSVLVQSSVIIILGANESSALG